MVSPSMTRLRYCAASLSTSSRVAFMKIDSSKTLAGSIRSTGTQPLLLLTPHVVIPRRRRHERRPHSSQLWFVQHEQALVEQRRERRFLHHHLVQAAINRRAFLYVVRSPRLHDLRVQLRAVVVEPANRRPLGVKEDVEEVVRVGKVRIPEIGRA